MAMLVDYATSDDDDEDPALSSASSPVQTPSTTPPAAPPAPPPSTLPSAAQLFATPTAPASTSDSSSLPRKRPQVNGSSHPSHAPKAPRANSSSVRTSSSGATLVPPQLRGRSNVATEDLDKLFVHRQQRKPE